MDVGEPSDWDRNLRNSSLNMLMNLASLALNTGFGPCGDILRETSPHEGPRDQLPGRTNTRMRKVV